MPRAVIAAYALAVRLRLTPQRVDVLVAALLVVGVLIELALARPIDATWSLDAVTWPLICGAVALRRRHPAVVGVAVQSLQVLQYTVSHGDSSGLLAVPWFMALYGLAVWTGTRMFVAGCLFFAVTNFAPWTDLDNQVFHDITAPFTIVTIIVMVLLRRIVGERERRAEMAERERDVAAREAVLDERARIARELHDAIAHNVSMMVLQAGAERRVIDGRAGGTHEVLEGIERTGRSALTEMRRLVGMLRSDRGDPLTPQPGLDDLPTLVNQVREAGLPVDLHVEGEPRDLPVGVTLSAYRIVQEALTNVLKHADQARATVRVRHAPDLLELEITDNGRGHPAAVNRGGHGLVGMRERVALYGGTFSAGRVPDGGFAVHVELPIR